MLTATQRQELKATLLIGLAAILCWCVMAPANAQEPRSAHVYRAELVRNARMVWGLDAPVAVFAAQVHQESNWRPNAVSRVGARGLAQFMPATATWISGLFPELAANAPGNPTWALRALVQYDLWLWDKIAARDDCERMAMTLSAYNGGLGWLLKDKATAQAAGADRARWWGHVERYNAGRSNANFAENRGYPTRILRVLQPRYTAWGPGVCA